MLLHGLTATRRYVVMGSRALERGGHRVIAYDARGHGRSTAAPQPDEYGYEKPARRPRGRAGRAWHRASDDRRSLDGRPYRVAPGAACGPSASLRSGSSPRRSIPRRRGRRRPSPAGTRSPGDSGRVVWRASSPPMTSRRCPRRGVRRSRRCSASGCRHTSTRRPSPMPWKPCRGRRPSPAWIELAAISVPTLVDRESRRGRPGPPAGRGGDATRGDPGCATDRRGRRTAAALADRLAGRPALEGARRAGRACVITYSRMPVTREWDGRSYDRISGPWRRMGTGGAGAAGARRR